MGLAIDTVAIVFTAILNLLFHYSFTGLPFLITVVFALAIWIFGIRVFHWLWFLVGLFFGWILIIILLTIIAIIIGVGILALLGAMP